MITVQGVNDVPVAASDAIAVLENGEVGLASAQNVLTDDTDPEGDTLSINAFRTGGLSVTDGTSGTVGEGLTGTYGTLTLNADGSYSYAATASAVEALGAGTTANDTFTYTVTDGDQTASAELVITVQGVNDAAILDLQASDSSVTRDAAFDTTGSGQILITDPDAGEAVLSSVTANYGNVAVDGEGLWTYTLDSTASEIQALASGATTTDTITFTSADGAETSTSITIYTANLPAVIQLTGVQGALSLTAGDPSGDSITGTITLTDNEGAFLVPISASYGAVTESGGDWSYVLANSSIAVLGLDAGESVTDTIAFQSSDAQDINQDGSLLDLDTDFDGTLDVIEGRQEVSVVVFGVNDAPVLTSQTVTADQNDITLQASQTLFAQTDDPDNADGSVTDTLLLVGARTGGLNALDGVDGTIDSGSGDVVLSGLYGTLTLGSDGSYNYVADESARDLGLESAGSVQDVFTFRVSDGDGVSEAELIFDIDNVAPVSVSGDIVHAVLSLTVPQLTIAYTDFDALTLTQDASLVAALPEGLVVSSAVSASGGELLLSGTPASSTISFAGDAITSVIGDYLIESTVSDGDNPDLVDRFVVSLRSDALLQTDGAIYEYVPGEVDYAAVYVDPATTGTILLNLWSPQETDDRIAVLRDPGLGSDTSLMLLVYASAGATLEVRGAEAVNLQYSPGADVITLTGGISGLEFSGIGESDTLINQTLILASTGTLALSLQNEGVLQLTSSGAGSNSAFDNSNDGVVGETLGAELSFGATTQSQTGSIFLTPDNDPAAPYLVLASLTSQGSISVSGYSGGSISQPSLLEISSADIPTAMSQTATASTLITSGGRLMAGSLDNAGEITLRYDLHDQGLGVGLASNVGAGAAGHLEVTGTYTESGLLISDGRSVNGSSGALADVNEVSVGSMILTGEVKLDADLLFSNTAQSLDWRQGTVSFAPEVVLRIAGGTLTLGENSNVTGYGTIVFGSELLPDASSGTTLSIDGSLATSQFEAFFDFSEDAVTISAVNNSDVLTLSASDELVFDNETVSANLQIDGALIVASRANALVGATSISASGELVLESSASTPTTVQLSVTQLLTNQGQIEINLAAPGQSVISSSPSLSSGSWTGGVATMTTSSAHGLTTGDVILVDSVNPSGYDYSGAITVVDSTTFTYDLAADPGGPATGGVIQVFANVLSLEGGLVNSGTFTVAQVGPEDVDASVYDHESVLIHGDLTNTVDGVLTFSDGSVRIEGDILNAGQMAIDGEAFSANSSGAGASVTLGGDLILAASSQLHLEIQDGGSFYGLTFPYLSAGIIRGADESPADLGALVLSFGNSADMSTSADATIIDLGYSDNFFVGTNFSTVSSNLAAGYSVSLQSNTYGTDTSRQTISVVVADDMEFVSTNGETNSFGSSDSWSPVNPTADIASVSYNSSTDVVTVTTVGAHGFSNGSSVTVLWSSYTNTAAITVVDAGSFSFSSAESPPSYSGAGTASELVNPSSLPGAGDDVRITHSLTIDAGSTVSLNSLSLESGGYLSTGFSSNTSVTSILLADQSAVAQSSSLSLGFSSGGSNGDVKLTVGAPLTINGTLYVYEGVTIDQVAGSNGGIVISESGDGFVYDSITLNSDLMIERGGSFSWSSISGTPEISGSGTISNAGEIEFNSFSDTMTLSVDLSNSGELDLRFSSGSSTGVISLMADAGVTLTNEGQLIASSFSSTGTLALNNNTLDSRNGELLLFVDSGTGSSTNSYSMALAGGATEASPGILMLGNTVFAGSARTVSISAVQTESNSQWTVTVTTSEAFSSFLSGPFFSSVTGGTFGESWVSETRQDGSVVYTNTFTRGSGDISISIADSKSGGGFYGASLTIDADGSISSSSNTTSVAELDLDGHLEIRLTDIVVFSDFNGTHALVLDGSGAESLLFSNDSNETLVWVNSETVRLNNLTVNTGVIFANAPNDKSDSDLVVTEITGNSLINGDFYNLSNGPNSPMVSELYVQGALTFNGDVVQESGAEIYIGSLASSAASVATTVTFAKDFSNSGDVTVGLAGGAENHTLTVGSNTSAGTFGNAGGFAVSAGSGTTTLDAQLNNTGDVLIQSQFVLDATAGANHVSNGVIGLEGANAGLTLGGTGSADVLTVSSAGYLVTSDLVASNPGSGIEIIVSSGSSLVIDGHLAIGDTVQSSEPGNVSLTTGIDDLTITTESELIIGSSGVVSMDVTYGTSTLNDALTVTTTTTGGVLRLSGGRLALSSVFSSAGATVTMITASSILGSFDTIDGLILDNGANRTVADIDQLATSITLTPLGDPGMLQEGSASGDVFDFEANPAISHYLGAGGDDLITGLGFGDTAYGEAGNDTFVLDVSGVRRIDGGDGFDRVVLSSTETAFDFTGGWLGHTFERIELLSMDDTLSQTLAIDAKGIKSIVDGQSDLLDGDVGLAIDGNAGDIINLSGDFEFSEDRYLLTHSASVSGSATTLDYQPELYTGVSDGSVSLFFDQAVSVNVTHSSGAISRYGDETDDTLSGTDKAGETLFGRAGDDMLDGKAGADRQLGGDGNDSIVYDSTDIQTDGGRGVDTLMVSGSIDFSQLTNPATNIEQINAAGNGTADTMTLTFSDVFDLVGDNSLAAYVTDHVNHSEHKVLVINGDNEDTLVLEGVDVREATPLASGIDLFGDGNLYALFQDDTLGLDIYVLSSLLESTESSGAVAGSPVMGSVSVGADLYEAPQDSFGGF